MMAQSVLGRQSEHVAESARKALHLTSAFADAMEERIKAARRVAKQSGDAAEEFLDDMTKRLRRHPVESVVVTLAVGVMAGMLVGRSRRLWN
jgi:ElaB/YqjD/DUF883 family membrane-anchored ribosome-binding protein